MPKPSETTTVWADTTRSHSAGQEGGLSGSGPASECPPSGNYRHRRSNRDAGRRLSTSPNRASPETWKHGLCNWLRIPSMKSLLLLGRNRICPRTRRYSRPSCAFILPSSQRTYFCAFVTL